jgi:hypothetical protein
MEIAPLANPLEAANDSIEAPETPIAPSSPPLIVAPNPTAAITEPPIGDTTPPPIPALMTSEPADPALAPAANETSPPDEVASDDLASPDDRVKDPEL